MVSSFAATSAAVCVPVECTHLVLLFLHADCWCCCTASMEGSDSPFSAYEHHALDVMAHSLRSITGEPVPWSDLPQDVLSVIGGLMSCPNQLNSATRVCKSWNQAIPSGVERLELDMNPCNQAWGAKVEQLQRLTPSLSRCKAHVSTAVPKMTFGANLRQLAEKLQNIQVCTVYGWSAGVCISSMVSAAWSHNRRTTRHKLVLEASGQQTSTSAH